MDGGQDPYQDHPKKKSDSFRKVFQQIQKLTEDNKKIAVIPFVDNSEDKEDYFKVGMTEALIAELSKVDELTVMSQESSRLLTEVTSTANMFISNI